MSAREGEQSLVANPNRITTRTWQDIHTRLGGVSLQLQSGNQLTPPEIEELTTMVD